MDLFLRYTPGSEPAGNSKPGQICGHVQIPMVLWEPYAQQELLLPNGCHQLRDIVRFDFLHPFSSILRPCFGHLSRSGWFYLVPLLLHFPGIEDSFLPGCSSPHPNSNQLLYIPKTQVRNLWTCISKRSMGHGLRGPRSMGQREGRPEQLKFIVVRPKFWPGEQIIAKIDVR